MPPVYDSKPPVAHTPQLQTYTDRTAPFDTAVG